MKHLYESVTELQVLRTVLDTPHKALILSQVDAEFFGNPDALKVYSRIKLYTETGKAIPSSLVMQNDESLDESARALISNSAQQYFTNEDDIKEAIARLAKYRKLRILFNTVQGVAGSLAVPNPDVDQVLDSIENMLGKCRTKSSEEEMKHFSHHNMDELAKEIEKDLDEDISKEVIPTGFTEYDQKTGLRRKNVLVMASVPGGGKSTMALQMAIHQYQRGFNVCYISYEMGELEFRYRILANISRINHSEIHLKKLNRAKKQLIIQRFKEFLSSSPHGNKFTMFTPKRDLDMNDIGLEIKPYGYDIIYVDYISLLKGNPKKQMWENLGEHARTAKLVANNTNSAIVMLAQYDDQGNKLKYSQAIQANANFVWAWEYGDKEKESDIVEVKQLKARNAPIYNFYLQKDFSIFNFKDYVGPPPIDKDPPEEDKHKKKASNGKPPPPMPKSEPATTAETPPKKPVDQRGIPRMPQLI